MAHVEQARLVELALGHSPHGDESTLRHLAECGRCRDELRAMARVVAAARAADVVDLPTAPPERVWQRIVRDLSDAPAGPPPRGTAPVPGRPGRTDGRGAGPHGRARRAALGAAAGGLAGGLGVLAVVAAARWRAGRRHAGLPVRGPGSP
ncbi:hypothetical protein ACF1DW_23580 [Streptomyces sp. NPDC014603]|uniref:hypothetical protein n=1 Tax=Streptomyces sp. NPDC014603 TaxID=3364873 RepID=UPI003700B42A